MKRLMDGIVNALKKKNHERSRVNDMYRIFVSSSMEPDDYYSREYCDNR